MIFSIFLGHLRSPFHFPGFSRFSRCTGNLEYALSNENKSVSNIVGYSNELQEHDPKETDTLLILHAVDTEKLNPFSECAVYSPDIDVFLLLINHYSKHRQVLHFL